VRGRGRDGGMDGWMDGWKDGGNGMEWMDRYIDEWIDGWIDGWQGLGVLASWLAGWAAIVIRSIGTGIIPRGGGCVGGRRCRGGGIMGASDTKGGFCLLLLGEWGGLGEREVGDVMVWFFFPSFFRTFWISSSPLN
jgi:hypothetical protein